MSAGDWGLLAALGTIWGGSYFFAKVALAELPPLTIVLGRVGMALIGLALAVMDGRLAAMLNRGRVAPSRLQSD